MTLQITPDHEKLILSLAARIRGSYGGKKKAERRNKAVKTNGKRNIVLQSA